MAAPPPPPPPFRSPPLMNVGTATPPPPARKLPPDPHEFGAPPPPGRLSPQAPPPRKYPNSNDSLDRSASVSPPPTMPPMPSSPLPPAPIPGSPNQPPMPSGALPPLPSAPLPALPQVDIPDENSIPHDSDHSEPATPTNMPVAPSSDASTQGILPPDDPIYQNRFTFISDLPPVPHWTSIPKHYVQGNPHPICPEIPGLSHSFHSSSSLSPNTSRVRSSSDSYIQAPTNSQKEFDQPTRMTRGSVGANLQSKSPITFGGGGARPLGSAPHRSPPAVPRSMFPLTVNTIPSPSSSANTSASVPSPQASPTNTNTSSPAAAPASSPPAIPKKPALLPKPHINTGTLTLSPTGTPQIPAKPVMSPKPNLPAKPSAASPSASPSSAATSSVPVAPPMGNNTPPSTSPQIPPRRTLPPTPST